MEIVYDRKDWTIKAVVATIGFFDGIHSGHCFLLREMRKVAKERGLPCAVITFPVHPRVVLHADFQPQLLNSFDEKMALFEKTGIDYVIIMDFTPELAALTARDFISNVLVPEWNVQTLFIGYDHRFGRRQTEEIEQYITDGKDFGLEVIKASSFHSDNGLVVSSSVIRRLIEAGDVAEASRLLGYPYRLKGHVVNGQQVGRQLGFPTANIAVDEKFKVIPRSGSYAAKIIIDDVKYNGMVYIGSRPTISADDTLHIEAHIFDFSEDIYNKSIIVEFVDFIREDRRFDSLDELREQMEQDKTQVQLIIDN